MDITFSNPELLVFLFLIPLAIMIHFFSINWKKKKALKFANFKAISNVTGIDFFSKNISLLIISCLIIFFLAFSISGATLHMTREITNSSFVIVIDNSQSMSASDLEPDRMEFSKKVAANMVDIMPEKTRIGLISFGAYTSIDHEIDDDKSSIKDKIEEIEISRIGGTDFYEGIVTSSNLLYGEESKSTILFSDGQVNIGDVEDSIRHAINNNIVVHTVAIGTEEGGEAIYGSSKLNRETLKALSYQTGGIFMEGSEGEINEKFEGILEVSEGRVGINIGIYLIIISIILFTLLFILINLKYDFLP